jgi:tungstate transport system ATP-binding protein
MSLLEVVDLSHSYGGREVLKGLNLGVGKGEVFALIGPTGAGKTTLLRIVDLLDVPAAGEIYFDGKCIPRSGKQRLEIRRRLSLIHQKPQVFNLSVYDNVACGLRWRGEKNNRIAEKVDHILEMVGLLLDEPTANLDPVSTAKIEQLISDVARQHNTTMIMATHDMSQGQQLADRIGVLLDGRLAQTGNVTDIFRSPQSEQVARFVGMENILEGAIIANNEGIVTVDIGGSAIQAVSNYPAAKEVYACIRPEDITLSLSTTQSSARNSFHAEVTRVTTIGPISRVEVDCDFRLVALVTRLSVEELNLQVGREVYATFKATGVHIMEKGIGK